jgi:protein-disulfide isomerase
MFEASRESTPVYFTKIAETIDWIDTQQFLDCMESNKYLEKIENTTLDFQKLWFSGVPVILINGKYFSWYPTQKNLIKLINSILQE